MRVWVVHPGVAWSVSDVFDGLCVGLRAQGVTLTTRPTGVDLIVIVCGLRLPATEIAHWRTLAPVVVLFTETPYELDAELALAAVVDGGWTHERTCVAAFQAVNPRTGYLRHAWHPTRHRPDSTDAAPAHDVVFVGSGFPERIAWFNSIDWTGIDLGLYGIWRGFGLDESIEDRCVKDATIENAYAGALYRRAKIGLNLYRSRNSRRERVMGESLSPRAYELAACGAFHLSDDRAEVAEYFGDAVPTFDSPARAAVLIREWLTRDQERASLASKLPLLVRSDSWIDRAGDLLADVHAWRVVQTGVSVVTH